MNDKLLRKLNHNGITYTPYIKTYSEKANERFIKQWGISYDYYLEMLLEQGGVCAICFGLDKSNKNLSVDHDHSTGKVRGLLCGLCNSGLGMFKDNIDNIERAIEYLNKSRLPETPKNSSKE